MVPLINFDAILPRKLQPNDNRIGLLEAKNAGKVQRLNALLDLEDIDAAKERIRGLDGEIKELKATLIVAQKAVKIAATEDDRLDQLILIIAALSLAAQEDRFLLRARIAQIRRIVDQVRLNNRREIRLMLKPASGYRPRWHSVKRSLTRCA